MLLRDHSEGHRASTPLELLFDLCFVVAVAVLAAGLHHALVENHAGSGVLAYVLVFIPVWWAWMSYTWYATAFDNDDVLFRVLTLLQMAGVLVLAASIPSLIGGNPVPFTLAYTAMRVPLVVQWLRGARDDEPNRRFASRYAVGIVIAQALWLLALAMPMPGRWAAWAIALLADLLTPIWATRVAAGRVFHAGHIAERYGLFTLIVLGETILAVSIGVAGVLEAGVLDVMTVAVCASALVVAFSIWWLYFDTLGPEGLERKRSAAFIWGYGHALLYASIAAIGAGIQAQIDPATTSPSLWWFALPTALALLSMAWLQQAANVRTRSALLLAVLAMLILVTPLALGRLPAVGEGSVAALVVVGVVIETVRRARLEHLA